MQVNTQSISKNKTKLSIIADKLELDSMKQHILEHHFQKDVKVPGFRQGKVPLELVEKNSDPNQVQGQFLDEIINDLYSRTIAEKRLKVIDQPKIEISKFVPYSQLEFTAEVDVLEDIKLPDYKKIKLAKGVVKTITKEEINTIIEKIRTQMAERKDVDRASKDGDQVWLDFAGVDDKGKKVEGATGKDYPLILGSNTFIPGFEENVVGLKANDHKEFTLKFPKDYHLKALASRDVTFTIDVTKVQEIIKPEINDELAVKSGPFKTLSELEEDIKTQLRLEKQIELDRAYEAELIQKITSKTTFDIPELLIETEISNKLRELRENITYRGQTMEEYLKQEGITEDKLRNKRLKPEAEDRLKHSIVLSEIAEAENIQVLGTEVDARVSQVRQQYTDEASQAEIAKPEFRQQIGSRIVAEKTLQLLTKYATTK
jgi:trigger factor